jgi:predicted amidophosphoribosyltransferase
MHPSITVSRVSKMIRKSQKDCDYYPGICKECGKEASNCEPDAEGYTCKYCGKPAVSGAENILMELA